MPRILGEAMHRSQSSKNLIIRLKTEARIGDPVLDSKGRFYGTIFDIFGPVDAPFASVRLHDDSMTLEGKELYLGEKKPRRGMRRKPRRR